MRKVLLGLSVPIISVLLGAAVDSGETWTADISNGQGRSLTHTFILKMEGKKVEGTAKFGREEKPITDGIVDGDTITFAVQYQAVNGTVQRQFRGIMRGETIDFAVTDPAGTVTTTARKVK